MTEVGGQQGGISQADIVCSAARAFERDRYLSSLLAPSDERDDLLALAAFAGEIARIPGDVSQPLIGEIRLQWWRDALDAAVGAGAEATGNPIADAVSAALRRKNVPIELVHRVLDAQVLRLDDRPFGDLDALAAHLAAYDGGLFEMAWRLLGGRGTPPALLAEAGVVYGLARCLIEAPAELAQGRIVLPWRLLEAQGLAQGLSHGLSHGLAVDPAADLVGSEEARAAWRSIQIDVAVAIEARLKLLARRFQEADRLVRLAVLPIALVRPYLKASKTGEIAALQALDIAPLTRVWRIWRASRTGRI